MVMCEMSDIKTVGIVGCGLIGSGWAARCLARGLNVIAFDPSDGFESKCRAYIDNAQIALRKMGFDRDLADQLSFVSDLDTLCEASDFIQESAPDNLDLKRKIHDQIDRLTDAKTVIASSSSGLLPTEIQSKTRNPERIVIGHPFNPVYILPLVEIVKGAKTSQSIADQAAKFYTDIGMYPLMVKKEIPGYISDRIQEAVWRESLHMVADGVASTQDIDDAIVYGPGLRWAIMGICLTFHLAGGEQGMKHMLEQFGPALKLPWTHMEAPELTSELSNRMIQGTKEQSKGIPIRELEQLRDNCLIEILEVLKKYDYAAGTTQFSSPE